ncbi:MAG: hypothetical protein NC350_03030 [Corallococcus sp.]|nr:hypothetical protein [Corallococcus sp.]
MRKDKSLPKIKTAKKTLTLDLQEGGDFDFLLNCRVKSGALEACGGFSQTDVVGADFSDAVAFWQLDGECIYVLTSDGNLKGISRVNADVCIPVGKVVCAIKAYIGGMFLFVLTQDGALYKLSRTEAVKADAPHMTNIVWCNGRLFGIGTDGKLYFSSVTDVCDFSVPNGGYIQPQEPVIALANVDGKVAAFSRNGVAVLTVSGCEEEFTAKFIACNCGKLMANSVACDGKRAYFYTEKGVASFDGAQVRYVCQTSLPQAETNGNACCVNGQYAYALGKLPCAITEADVGGSAVYVRSDEDEAVISMPSSVVFLGVYDGKIAAICSGFGKLFVYDGRSAAGFSYARVKPAFFTQRAPAKLKTLELYAQNPLTATVICDGRIRRYFVPSGRNSVFVGAMGRKFEFAFCSASLCVTYAKAVFTTVEEV